MKHHKLLEKLRYYYLFEMWQEYDIVFEQLRESGYFLQEDNNLCPIINLYSSTQEKQK